jgi:hypothetical protein
MNADSLVGFVLEQTAKKSWTSETVLRVGVDVAMKVNQLKDLKGLEKKQLVLDVLQKAMVKCEEAEKADKADTAEITERWAALRKIANDVLPVSLDLVVSAARGTFDFKKISPKTWVEYFCCFFQAATGVLAAEHVIPEKVAVAVAATAKKVEEKMIVVVDLSGARQVHVLTDLSGTSVDLSVDLSGVNVSLAPKVLPSEQVKEWAAVATETAVVASQESVTAVVPAIDEKKEDAPQS